VWEMIGTEVKPLADWLADSPVPSYQLVLLAGGLLILAAALLWVQRWKRIALESSVVSEELMIYLARIANALERPLPQGPNMDEVTREVLRRLEQIANAKPNGKLREMPQTMFGREFPEKG
jgi:hypothetical protein